MGDLGSEILKKYGTVAVIFAIVASVIIWFLAHWTAAPGKEVSVLWGLVKYTKQPRIASTSYQKIPKEGTSDKLPEINIVTRNGVSNENLQKPLNDSQSQIKTRKLSAMESGKNFAQKGVWKCGNDACISKDVVEMIRDYSKEQPIYIAYDGNGWCINQNNLGEKLIPDGDIFRAAGLAEQDFNIFQLPDGKYPRDYANGINWLPLHIIRQYQWVNCNKQHRIGCVIEAE